MKNTDNFEAYQIAGFIEEGKFSKVLKYCNSCLKTNEFCGKAYFYKAYAHNQLKDYKKAAQTIEKALNIKLSRHDLALIYIQKMNLLDNMNLLDEALLTIDKAIELYPRTARFYVLKTTLLYRLHRFGDAIVTNRVAQEFDYQHEYTEEIELIREKIKEAIDRVIRGEIDLVD